MGAVIASSLDVQSIRKDFPILSQQIDGKPLIWMDSASTTQKPRCVIDTLTQFYERYNSNVHRTAHTLGIQATDAYEQAREKVQHFIGAASSSEIIFVRGTTEAINLVAQSYGRQVIGPGDEILLSTLEHHSNLVPWQLLAEEKGAILKAIPIDDRGDIELAAYRQLLGPRTRLVGLTHVSNTIGTVLPLQTLIELAHQVGACTVIDGAQAVSHFPVNVQTLDCDFYAFSGHKMFGPTGVGVLYGKQSLLEGMRPWQGGGSMIRQVTFAKTTFADLPAKFEAGTPSIADVIGLGAAIDYLSQLGMAEIERYDRQLMTYTVAQLAGIPGLQLIGSPSNQVGVLSFVLAGMTTEAVGQYLNQQGIAVRAGHHCAQPALQRYGVTSTVRPSLAFYNLLEEVDILVQSLQNLN